ncbi:MAG: zinc-binding dehydrogenase, partial [Chloroflexota bacterium]|nr:zinc-binding dehydrogenase [Chloroflexota bacterium]
INPHRLELAHRLGATRTLDVSTEPLAEAGISADVLIECSGQQAALADGIRSLRPAGVIVAVGMNPYEDVTIPMAYLQNHELTLTGTFRYANTYPVAIALAGSGKVNLDAIVTGHYGLDQTQEALTVSKLDPASVKPMVTPGSEG